MEVWKIIFLSKWGIGRFHVNLPGCCDAFFCFRDSKAVRFFGSPNNGLPNILDERPDRSRQQAAHFAWPRSCKRKWRRCGSKVVKQHTELEHSPSITFYQQAMNFRDSSNIVGERGIDSKGVLQFSWSGGRASRSRSRSDRDVFRDI